MKFAVVVLVLAVSQVLALTQDPLVQEWNQYKALHNKEYSSSAEEFARFNIWKTHLQFIEQHNKQANAGEKSHWVAMNHFGDLTNKEFVAIFNGFKPSMKKASKNPIFQFDQSVSVPTSVDWRTQGYVTPVKDQGRCGSCWAFSTTGSLEGQHFKKTGNLVSLSEQNLVDCSRKQGNMGCNGGLMDQAFTYIKENNGIDTESSYPYHASDSKCKFNPANVGATDTGYTDVQSMNENALMQAVGTVGPVSVAIDASHTSFQLYSHGIYHEPRCSETRLDHGVLAVGYGSEGTTKDYWIVKNSWSSSWGDHGYIKMSRNKHNNCGIATAASFPLV